MVFVTIDDGFTRDPRVVEFVRAHHWPISAFVIGSVAEQDPGYFKALAQAGATIEDHTQDHPDLPKLSVADQERESCGPRARYPILLGATPRLVRPPYGNFDDTTRRAAAACGIRTLVIWNATMLDGALDIVGRNDFRPGDIVLLHFRRSLLQDLTALSLRFAAAGLRVARLEDYVS
ncbi:MAG TPA: polysaccharide deacetylase family protein [Acidimicrobiia bacterium]|nr:polysaccharide deacetylase family protein [Acidimicrobiia bacterium]